MGMQPYGRYVVSGGLLLAASAMLGACEPSSFEGYCLASEPGCGGPGDDAGQGGYGYGGQAGWGGTSGAGGYGGYAGEGGYGGYGGGQGGVGGAAPGAEVFAETDLGMGGWWLAVGGGYVYFAVWGQVAPSNQFIILRKATGGGAVETVVSGVASSLNELDLFANDTHLYFTTADMGVRTLQHGNPYEVHPYYPGAVTPPNGPRRFTVNASGHTCMARQEAPQQLLVEGSYWGAAALSVAIANAPIPAFAIDEQGACYIALLDGAPRLLKLATQGAPQELVSGHVTGLAGWGETLFYAVNQPTADIFRFGYPPVYLASGVPQSEIAADPPYVYYGGVGGAYQAMRVPEGGGPPTTLGESPEAFTTLRLGPSHVYWTGIPSGPYQRVYRAAR